MQYREAYCWEQSELDVGAEVTAIQIQSHLPKVHNFVREELKVINIDVGFEERLYHPLNASMSSSQRNLADVTDNVKERHGDKL